MKYLVCQAVLLGLCLGVCGENPHSSPKKIIDADTADLQPLMYIIEEQLASIRAGDIDKAYSDYTSNEFKKNTTHEQFKKFVKDFPVISQNQSLVFNSVNFEKSIATFEGALNSKNGDSLQAEYDLVQENGKWKILGIQLFKSGSTHRRSEKPKLP